MNPQLAIHAGKMFQAQQTPDALPLGAGSTHRVLPTSPPLDSLDFHLLRCLPLHTPGSPHPGVSTPWRGHILTPSCPLPRFVANVVDLSIFLPTLTTLFYFSTQKHLRSFLPLCLNGCYFSCLTHYSFCMQTTPQSRRPGSFSLKPMTCLPPALSKPTLLFFAPFFFWPAHAEGLRFGSGVTSSRKPSLMVFSPCAPIAQYRSLYGSQS